MKQGSNQGIRFFIMETLKEGYKGGDREKIIPKYVIGAFGGFAGKRTKLISNSSNKISDVHHYKLFNKFGQRCDNS